MQFAEVALNGWRHFYPLPRKKRGEDCRLRIIRTYSPAADSIFPSAKKIASFTNCMSIFSNCDAKTPVFSSRFAAESTAPSWGLRVSFYDIFLRKMMKQE